MCSHLAKSIQLKAACTNSIHDGSIVYDLDFYPKLLGAQVQVCVCSGPVAHAASARPAVCPTMVAEKPKLDC